MQKRPFNKNQVQVLRKMLAENPRDFFPIDSFVEELVDGVGAGDALLAASTLSLITSKNILISVSRYCIVHISFI